MEENSQQKQKLKRRRLNPTHRWTESQVLHLLQAVADVVKETPESFEKPTAQRFYEKMQVSTPALQCILWVALKSKMWHLKSCYLSAVAWKGKTGAGLLANGDEASVSAYINKICPHWDLLNDIFGQRKNVNPGVIFESTHNVETLDDTPEMSSSLTESSQCFASSTFELCEDSVDPPMTSISHCNATTGPSTPESTYNFRNLTKKTKFDNPFNNLLLIQEKRLKLEVEKLEFEKEKERNQMQLKKIELQNQLEIEKIKLERLAFHRGGCIICVDYSSWSGKPYIELLRRFDAISEVLYEQFLQLIHIGLDPSKMFIFGFSYGGQIASKIGRLLKPQYTIKKIDICDMAGPGFDFFTHSNHSEAAENVQCYYSSLDKGSHFYSCHQNIHLGQCGYTQPAILSQPHFSSHGLCVRIYINAFDFPFYAIQKTAQWCEKGKTVSDLPYEFTVGYREDGYKNTKGDIFVPTTLNYPYNLSKKEIVLYEKYLQGA